MKIWKKLAAGIALIVGLNVKAANQVHTESGVVEGTLSSDSKIHIFKGIPYAVAPVGNLRWQPPQSLAPWDSVRKATEFGPRCMQGRIFEDMVFRDSGPSEDCLYLNIWTPADSADAHLPVMVWIYGGGFQAGSASEPRQDGTNLARKGVVLVSFNYRLGIFGFFSYPELTKESPHRASGNYGFLDQVAALEWVHKNIAGFGGDPNNVTIFGESAGSMSVSALMASPLSKNLFQHAIGESGAVFPLGPPMLPVSKTEAAGVEFAKSIGANTLGALRAKPASELLEAVLKGGAFRFWPNVDGYFFPKEPSDIYAGGEQAHVPLLAGWNDAEQNSHAFFGKLEPTKENYIVKVRELYKNHADEILKLYPSNTEQEIKASARALASDQFIAYSTWKWLEMQVKTGKAAVYRYYFLQAPPVPAGEPSRGAYHSADIEYVFGTLDWKQLAWTADDRKMSDIISSYWTNFAKTANPNGPGLPEWPIYKKADRYRVMNLHEGPLMVGGKEVFPQLSPVAISDRLRARYLLLDDIAHERAGAAGDGGQSR